MTANTKMTKDQAKKIIASFPPEFNASALPGYYYKAVGFLEGFQAGRAEMAEEAAYLVTNWEGKIIPMIDAIRALPQRDGGN